MNQRGEEEQVDEGLNVMEEQPRGSGAQTGKKGGAEETYVS
jgi:hypothetical protein